MMLKRIRLLLVLLGSATAATAVDVSSTDIRAAFDDWKARHQKTYNSIKEEVERFQVWVKNNGEKIFAKIRFLPSSNINCVQLLMVYFLVIKNH
jgi:hypothetical protein